MESRVREAKARLGAYFAFYKSDAFIRRSATAPGCESVAPKVAAQSHFNG